MSVDGTDEGASLGATRLQYWNLRQRVKMNVPGLKFLGLKGAALAALGERPGCFDAPLTVRDAGVKLGESTLNLFLTLKRHEQGV